MIKHIRSVKQVTPFLSKGTLFIFDIDNTLIATCESFGSEHWEKCMIDQLVEMQMDPKEAVSRATAIWQAIQHVINVSPVEIEMPNFINSLPSKGIEYIAITMRSPSLMQMTLHQLRELGYPFFNNISKNEMVIFCENRDKGIVVKEYIRSMHKLPERVILLDDQIRNIESTKNELKDLEIPFIGLKYTHLDNKFAKYELDDFSRLLCKIMCNQNSRTFFARGFI